MFNTYADAATATTPSSLAFHFSSPAAHLFLLSFHIGLFII